MANKVKRGLGLIVVAVVLVIAWSVIAGANNETEGDYLVLRIFDSLTFLAALGTFVAGLVVIAWGLLKD